MAEVNILSILDEMDAYRRKHYYDKNRAPDHDIRIMCAIVARAGGYESRWDWTDALKQNPATKYAQDYQNSEYWGTF